ncbi:hypothetical protein OAT84_02935 [Gammaproteobacteria bacterium]|nr:hypothetical protein [Gammaproteobacteria bacterium]
MERICKHMIIGLLGLNSISVAEDITYWVEAGYNSNYLRFTSTELDEEASQLSAFIAPYTSNVSAYGGFSAEYSVTPSTAVGAHIDFSGYSRKIGLANIDAYLIEDNRASWDRIIDQSISPTIGVFSSYQWNNTAFTIGLDLDRISLNEMFSLSLTSYQFSKFESVTSYNPKIVLGTSTKFSRYRIGLSAYWGPSLAISSDDSAGASSPINQLSFGESGIKLSVSHSLMPLLQSI